MRRNIRNDKVLRAITIGLATMIATTSTPITTFAEAQDPIENNGIVDTQTSSSEVKAAEDAANAASQVADSANTGASQDVSDVSNNDGTTQDAVKNLNDASDKKQAADNALKEYNIAKSDIEDYLASFENNSQLYNNIAEAARVEEEHIRGLEGKIAELKGLIEKIHFDEAFGSEELKKANDKLVELSKQMKETKEALVQAKEIKGELDKKLEAIDKSAADKRYQIIARQNAQQPGGASTPVAVAPGSGEDAGSGSGSSSSDSGAPTILPTAGAAALAPTATPILTPVAASGATTGASLSGTTGRPASGVAGVRNENDAKADDKASGTDQNSDDKKKEADNKTGAENSGEKTEQNSMKKNINEVDVPLGLTQEDEFINLNFLWLAALLAAGIAAEEYFRRTFKRKKDDDYK